MNRIKSKTAIDLFCGCGGISAGLQMAGYEVLAGLDIEKKYISTFSHNFRSAKAITEDISWAAPEEFANSLQIEPEQIDLLVGGPPCQGFSKNVPRKHRYLEDPKNLLVKAFIEHALFLRPTVILMENVAEMKNGFDGQYTDEIITRLDAGGYKVTHAVLNSADYEVPQRRRRAFFMATRLGFTFKTPTPTHIQNKDGSLFLGEPFHVNVWDAIGDLPSLEHGEGHEIAPYATSAFSSYQKRVQQSRRSCAQPCLSVFAAHTICASGGFAAGRRQ